jgi:hypothetical protein
MSSKYLLVRYSSCSHSRIASQATKTESDMAGPRARAGQLIVQAAPAAKSALARPPASWIDPSAVAFQIMLCGPRKESA